MIFAEYIKILKNQKQQLQNFQADATARLDTAIANNDLVGTLDAISYIHMLDVQLRGINDKIDLVQLLIDRADNDVEAADLLYDEIVSLYRSKGLNKNVIQKADQLKKLLRW